ncbi:N-6 DNA methylase [Mangrovicella endophytica]|uniref:N-6 DNA methylase n=1 Tax=Mangrovicella endophytica TaxID=2066697 RepID=UPI000C9E19D5|nr:N-6 DNA methylase [Mangrovicella endophytica]
MLDLASHTAGEHAYNGKTLTERVAGRFYTPAQLADDIAEQMVSALKTTGLTKVVATDPFCGDGRLVMALLSVAARNSKLAKLPWVIELRDREAAAAKTAGDHVRAAALRLGMDVETVVIVGDTFASDLSPRFDFVITNPPWELLKPDSREIKHLTLKDAERYKTDLRAASRVLDNRFPDARADGAWGGWGTNLARCGWDLCMSIARKGGVVGVILPATIMGDQSSVPMRRKAFSSGTLVDAAAYPSEARLFDRVDQSVVALTMRVGGRVSASGRIRCFDANRLPAGEQTIMLKAPAMEARGWTIPTGRPAGVHELADLFVGMSTLQSLEGEGATDLWLGRELDETRISEKLVAGSSHPFIKGRMIARHGIVDEPTMSVRPALCGGFHSAARPRAVWRDVARATSKRRMIGTVIPAGWVAGNSLHVACYRDGDPDRTLALHALLSSFVVEAQVRERLRTGHMSLGVVRQARIPTLDASLIKSLSSLARGAMHGGGVPAERRLEISVAKAYGLDRDDMARLLDDFPKLEEWEREALTSVAAWTE